MSLTMPEDVKSGDLGCGRILADYSIFMQTRYVLAALYLTWNSTHSKFGPKESAGIAEIIKNY